MLFDRVSELSQRAKRNVANLAIPFAASIAHCNRIGTSPTLTNAKTVHGDNGESCAVQSAYETQPYTSGLIHHVSL